MRVVLSDVCPIPALITVSGVPQSQRFRDIEQDSDFSDKFIQLALLLAVISVAVVFCQYGEYIGRSIAITVDDVLQLRLDAHREHLPRFVACIGQYAVMDVAVAQVDHIYERHAAGEETEHEDVACEGVLGMQRREVGRAYPFDGFA